MPFANGETILTSGRSNADVSMGFTEIRTPGSVSEKGIHRENFHAS